jgi:hypothetical protein
LNFACKGQTYIPVPTGDGKNFAGMLTVDLPQAVVAGQEFTAIVRRLTTKRADVETQPPPVPQVQAVARRKPLPITNWRSMVGSFAITIPIATPAALLPAEYDTLAIFKWRLSLMAPSNRWYPVMQRYITYVAGRIGGMGGNPILVQPSPYGASGSPIPIGGGGGPPVNPPPHNHKSGYMGKVEGLIYDRFGDFEGFSMEMEDGKERRFHSRKTRIEELVRYAWRDQVVITVRPEHHDARVPESIILHRPTVGRFIG